MWAGAVSSNVDYFGFSSSENFIVGGNGETSAVGGYFLYLCVLCLLGLLAVLLGGSGLDVAAAVSPLTVAGVVVADFASLFCFFTAAAAAASEICSLRPPSRPILFFSPFLFLFFPAASSRLHVLVRLITFFPRFSLFLPLPSPPPLLPFFSSFLPSTTHSPTISVRSSFLPSPSISP